VKFVANTEKTSHVRVFEMLAIRKSVVEHVLLCVDSVFFAWQLILCTPECTSKKKAPHATYCLLCSSNKNSFVN